MKTAVNPAVTSSETGSSPSSSRLRAVTRCPARACARCRPRRRASAAGGPAPAGAAERSSARAGTELTYTRVVEVDAERQVVGHAPVERHEPAVVLADEVDAARSRDTAPTVSPASTASTTQRDDEPLEGDAALARRALRTARLRGSAARLGGCGRVAAAPHACRYPAPTAAAPTIGLLRSGTAGVLARRRRGGTGPR